MVKTKVVFEAVDGRTFDTLEEAQKYEETTFQGKPLVIDRRLKHIFHPGVYYIPTAAYTSVGLNQNYWISEILFVEVREREDFVPQENTIYLYSEYVFKDYGGNEVVLTYPLQLQSVKRNYEDFIYGYTD